MFSGTVKARDRVRLEGPIHIRTGKVTAVRVFEQGSTVERSCVRAGEIGLLRGLADVRIGDRLAVLGPAQPEVDHQRPLRPSGGGHFFAPPTLETVVTPVRRHDRGRLHAALTQLAEQDPLIDLRQDDTRHELSLSLYGEVQKEVIQATLADEYGIEVDFRETTTVCIERLLGPGAAVETMNVDPNPFLATVGLRLEPGPVGVGVTFELEVELGSMPLAFIRAIEDTVRETLHQGLSGWEVPDCRVTLTRSGYAPRQSHAHATFDKSMSSTGADFRSLTPLVVMTALREAGTRVCEPLHRFRLEVPADTFGAVMPALAAVGAVPHASTTAGSLGTIEGEIPAARVHQLQRRLPGLSRGEGVLESTFDHHQPVRGPVLTRPRLGPDPSDRKEYLLRVERRVPAGSASHL
jgi:ribosomal protection tetracycline resistance protein